MLRLFASCLAWLQPTISVRHLPVKLIIMKRFFFSILEINSHVRAHFLCGVNIHPQLVMYSIYRPAGQTQGKTWQPGTLCDSLEQFITQTNISTVIRELLHDWITLLSLFFPVLYWRMLLFCCRSPTFGPLSDQNALFSSSWLTYFHISKRPVFQSSLASEIALGHFPALRLLSPFV